MNVTDIANNIENQSGQYFWKFQLLDLLVGWKFDILLWPRCHNSKVRRFSQGLRCKTPLRTHSKQAMLLPSTQLSLKPVNHSYSQMPRLSNENKTQTSILLLGVQREAWLDVTMVTSLNSLNPLLATEVKMWVSGGQDVGTEWRTRQRELKQSVKEDKKVPLPTLRSQALSYPLFK